MEDPKGRPKVPFDRIQPGDAFGPLVHELGRALVARHLRATEQEPYPDPGLAPVSILAADGVQLADRFFDISQSVHAGQRLRVERVPRIGDRLTVRGEARDKFVRRGRRYVVTDTVTEDGRGRVVARGTTTGVLVYAEGKEHEAPRPAPPPTAPDEVKERLGPLVRTMTLEKMRLYEPPDERVADGADLATGLIEPTTLLAALAKRDVGGSALVAVMALGGLALSRNPRFCLRTGFATPASVPLVAQGRCEYLPLLFSEARRHMASARWDCALVRLAPPDEDGLCSYGWAAGFTPELVDAARARGIPILAEIDPGLPRTRSGREVPAAAIDAACLAEGEAASDAPVPPSPHAEAVARHLAPLVPDGATLQVGIGSVPDAAVERLDARDLGIHTEVLGPGLASLVKRGRATGARKAADRGLAVCTIASVDPEVRVLVESPERAAVRAASDVLDPRRVAEHDALRCINSALAVDLRGQVNAESFGWEQRAGVGGQLDFFRGAGLRDDALRIVALASETSRGQSRIVAGHPPGAVVTATRYDVDVVVTEHGAAWLRDRTDEERARALVAVAHPRHRADLERARFGSG